MSLEKPRVWTTVGKKFWDMLVCLDAEFEQCTFFEAIGCKVLFGIVSTMY
jgi:hypothetical protein